MRRNSIPERCAPFQSAEAGNTFRPSIPGRAPAGRGFRPLSPSTPHTLHFRAPAGTAGRRPGRPLPVREVGVVGADALAGRCVGRGMNV